MDNNNTPPQDPNNPPDASTPVPWDSQQTTPAVPASAPQSPWGNNAASTPLPDPLAPTRQTQWPSSTSTLNFDTPVHTTPPSTEQTTVVDNPNPFLTPPAAGEFSLPASPGISEPFPAQTMNTPFIPPSNPAQPQGNEISPDPNPLESTPSDPLNTAFTPNVAPPQLNPFALPDQGAPAPIPQTPQAVPDFLSPPAAAPAQAQTPDSDLGLPPPAPGQEGLNQSGPLDLSALQSNSNPTGENQQPELAQPGSGNPIPDVNPSENAPTDLSHLIADDQSGNASNLYTPPVSADQNPMVNPSLPLTENEGSTPPPEKHLNLTKVILIAGIPIILIIAALSAYLILGIGKSSPSTDQSQPSLPIEQTQSQLTNPPKQINTPTPLILPEPKASVSSNLATPSASASSPASALETLRARQQSTASSTPTPTASESTSLPN